MSNIQVFNFNTSNVRVVSDDKGEFWFLANDICAILGYTNPRRTISLHCKDKGVTKRYTPTESGKQEMTYINEPNLYRLIIKSQKPEAEPFEEWVMEEVLPQIRKTGSYTLTLTTEQQFSVKEAVNRLSAHSGETHQSIYRRLYHRFQVPRYQEIKAADFQAAMNFLAGIQDAPELFIQPEPQGILFTEQQIHQFAVLTYYAQHMGLLLEDLSGGLRRLGSNHSGRAYDLANESHAWLIDCQRSLMTAFKQMQNPAHIQGVKNIFARMM